MNMLKVMLLSLSMTAFCGELEDSYKKIPEIMKDHEKVVNVIWNLSKTNQLPFIITMNKAIEAYPCSMTEKSELRNEFRGWYKIATNSVAPTTSLRIDWHKQLEHQNILELKGMNVRSDPETTDFNRDASNPSGVELITSPFFTQPIPRNRLEPMPYYGQ